MVKTMASSVSSRPLWASTPASRISRRPRQYYTLGKLTHYLADAFTYPHNEHYPESLIAHRQYEADLRQYLADYLENRTLRRANARQDLVDAISELHAQYMSTVTDMRRDVQFILRATQLLMAGCLPAAA